jgi:hypothetical protein
VPVPLPAVRLSQLAFEAALHSQFDAEAVTWTVPSPPAGANESDPGDTVNAQLGPGFGGVGVGGPGVGGAGGIGAGGVGPAGGPEGSAAACDTE